MRSATRPPESFAEFWPHYVGEHRRPLCRAIHYVGGVAAIALVAWGLWAGAPWALLLAPIAGYAFAWVGHFWVEGNRPATWGYVWWSVRGEFKMLWLGLTLRMRAEVERLFGSANPSPDAPLLER
jgi:hypothetical protein